MFLRDLRILERAKTDNDYIGLLLQTTECKRFIHDAIRAYTKSPARFMAVNRIEWDDLYQLACIGLTKAFWRMDLTLTENEWVRYAYLSIQSELRNIARSNNSNLLSISQRVRGLYPHYKKFHEDFWLRHARDPTIQETKDAFHLTREDAFALVYGMQDILLGESAERAALQGTSAGLSHKAWPSVEEEAIHHVLVESVLNELDDIQRRVIVLHYFRGLTKTEVSRILNCSLSMVCKHLTAAFRHVQKRHLVGP